MTADDVRWAVAEFRSYRWHGEDRAPWQRLRVMTWIREPDYSDDYRRLRALELELSDTPYHRGEMGLLSVWRLAPTPEMLAKWDAKGKELIALGAKEIFRCDGTWGLATATVFEMANGKEFRIWYSLDRGEYYIMGKARIHNDKGFDKTVEDGWIKVPGPAPKLPED